jgi:hypothetical protein
MVNNINLGEMDASDMCDVLHYYFEEDLRYASPESAEMVTKVREHVYGVMYGIPYRWGIKSSTNKGSVSNSNSNYDFDSEEVKPYVAPTEFDQSSSMPYGDLLDAPIG